MYQVGVNNRKDMDKLFKVSNMIKDIIFNMDIEYFKDRIIYQYRVLNLLDDNGKWMTERLNNLCDKLIPGDINLYNLEMFIDEITILCTRNNYLMNVFNECSNNSFEKLQSKFELEGKDIITDVFIYAYMVEILSKECSKDSLILEELYHCFSVSRNKKKSFKDLPLAYKIKLISVERYIRRYVKCHKKKKLDKKFGRTLISKDIFVCMCIDLIHGKLGNVKAGFILFKNRCGLSCKDEYTGAGPTVWSNDGKIIEYYFPLAESWNNLYQVWNMSFFTKFGDFPYTIFALLIPQVSSYYNNPHKYIYNMNISLYITLNFLSFSYNDKKKKGKDVMDWSDKNLRRIFSISNRKSAEIYNEKLKKVRM